MLESRGLVKFRIRLRLKILLLIWPAVVLACNLPAPIFYSEDISSSNLRETLRAQDFDSTLTPNPPEIHPEDVFNGEPTPTEEPFSWAAPKPIQIPSTGYWEYTTQSGDTLQALALRFGVEQADIIATANLPAVGFIHSDRHLIIPNNIGNPPYAAALLPDSEVVNVGVGNA